MDRIGGFSYGEIIALVNRCDEARKTGKPLVGVFKTFADKYSRSAGSVRNFYYMLINKAQSDVGLKEKYFKDKDITLNRPTHFKKEEALELIDKIAEGKSNNLSVRKTVINLGGGDEKLTLRFQNKYRNMLKTEPSVIAEAARRHNLYSLSKSSSAKLRAELNTAVDKIAERVNRDNAELKKRIEELERENLQLTFKLNEAERQGVLNN